MRIGSALLIGLLTLLVLPGEAFSQGRRGRGGDRGGRGGFDPGSMFDRISGGKNEIVLSEVTDPRAQGMLKRIVDSLGITNGKITREQFTEGMQGMMRSRPSRGGGSGGGFPSRPDSGRPSSSGGPSGKKEEASAATVDQWAEAEFKRRDRNGDGVLNEDEMSRSLRADWQRWDANKDGVIDLKEFKAFFADQIKQQQQTVNSQVLISGSPQEEDKRPVVLRFGKEPKGLPPWFKQLDTDNDGQVALYEWRKSGKPLSEFHEMDRNHDGFLTMEEVMYYLAKNPAKSKGGPVVTSLNPPRGGPDAGGRDGSSRKRGGR